MISLIDQDKQREVGVIKKISYFIAVLIASSLLVICYFLFFTTEKTAGIDQTALTLQPFTAKEQRELINAEEREETAKPTGPLIALTSVTDAEAKVLNMNRK